MLNAVIDVIYSIYRANSPLSVRVRKIPMHVHTCSIEQNSQELFVSSEFENNISLSDLAHNAENMTLHSQPFQIENFSYKNNIVLETMFKHLENTNFLGVSVR